MREGITADTVCLEDIVDSFVKSTPEGIKLAHQDHLISASKNWDRHALTGQNVFATRGINDIRGIIEALEHQLIVAKMFKSRALKTQMSVNRQWLAGADPTQENG